jgi:hypothetical protein
MLWSHPVTSQRLHVFIPVLSAINYQFSLSAGPFLSVQTCSSNFPSSTNTFPQWLSITVKVPSKDKKSPPPELSKAQEQAA